MVQSTCWWGYRVCSRPEASTSHCAVHCILIWAIWCLVHRTFGFSVANLKAKINAHERQSIDDDRMNNRIVLLIELPFGLVFYTKHILVSPTQSINARESIRLCHKIE